MAGDKELRVKLEVEADTKKAKEFADVVEEIPEKVETELAVDAGQSAQAVSDVRDDLEKLTSEEHRLKVSVDDAALSAASKRAKAGIDDIGKSADSSKSVLANMVGNATQDLGALSGVAGSAGVAIGQMAEYMADAAATGEGIGSIAGNFAKVIGPVAAISLGVGLLSTVLGNMGKEAEEARKRAEAFGKAVEDAGGNVAGAFAQLAKAGNFDDLIDDLDRLGISFEQFVELASGGAVPIDPVRADVLARVEKLTDLYQDGSINSGKYFKEVKKLGAEMDVTGEEALAMAKSLNEVKDTADESGDAIQGAVDAYAAQRRVMQDNADLIDVINEAVKRKIDVDGKSKEELVRLMGQQDLQTAQQLALNEAIAVGNEEMAEMARVTREEATAETDRLREALEDLNAELDTQRGAILSQAELRVALAEAQERYLESLADEKATVDERVVNAQKVAEGFAAIMGAIAEANGEPFDKNGAIVASLEETAKQADGPTKDAILNVVDALKKVPPSTSTDMVVNNADALAKINAVIRQLQILRDEAAVMREIARGGPVSLPPGVASTSTAVTQNITVNAGFGTDAFAVRAAVLSSARQAARLAQGATRYGS